MVFRGLCRDPQALWATAEGTDRPTRYKRSLALLGPETSQHLFAQRWSKVPTVPCDTSAFSNVWKVQVRIWGVQFSKHGNGGDAALNWEKVQGQEGQWGLPPTGN